MKIETHNINDTKIAEVISEVNIINKIEDVFSKYTSKSLNDFILESNKARHINFVSSCTEAIKILAHR